MDISVESKFVKGLSGQRSASVSTYQRSVEHFAPKSGETKSVVVPSAKSPKSK